MALARHGPGVAAGRLARQRQADRAGLQRRGRRPGVPQPREEHRALAARRIHIELVGQALERAQPGAGGAGAGDAVAQRQAHVRDAGAAVVTEHFDAVGLAAVHHRQRQAALAGVLEHVGGELGDDDGQLAGAGVVKAQLLRQPLPQTAGGGDIAGMGDRHPVRFFQRIDYFFHLVIATAVPSPLRESISNSSTRRLAPPSPNPSPPPLV
ncbi:hypothetical protein DUGA2_58880 [Duganella sp. HH101]|nr:hypothetical protein DUGA2_58880 [Duganella sp. HH101]